MVEPDEEEEKLQALWTVMDEDGSGTLDQDETKKILVAMGQDQLATNEKKFAKGALRSSHARPACFDVLRKMLMALAAAIAASHDPEPCSWFSCFPLPRPMATYQSHLVSLLLLFRKIHWKTFTNKQSSFMIVFLSRPIICRNRFSSHWNADTDISSGEMFQRKNFLVLEYLIRD